MSDHQEKKLHQGIKKIKSMHSIRDAGVYWLSDFGRILKNLEEIKIELLYTPP